MNKLVLKLCRFDITYCAGAAACALLLSYYSPLLYGNNQLNALAIKYNTDKSSHSHNYTEIYESYFSHMQNKPIKFLEIGFLLGSSAHMWETYFTQAQLHYIDIDIHCYQNAKQLSPRSHLHIIDQSNTLQLKKFAEESGGDFDIIIDDGSHIMHHQIISFKILFPYVKAGGIYVIEDLCTSYWKSHGSIGSCENPIASHDSTIRFLQALIDDVNYTAARNVSANFEICPKEIIDNCNYYQKNIKSLHFYSSVCLIIKR